MPCGRWTPALPKPMPAYVAARLISARASASSGWSTARGRERATIVITMDVSRSMLAEDVSPNRLNAAKSAAQDFLNLLPTHHRLILQPA